MGLLGPHALPFTYGIVIRVKQEGRGRGTSSGSEQLEDLPLFREHPSSRSGRTRDSGKRLGSKKSRQSSLLIVSIQGDILADIGLDVEESTMRGLPQQKRKRQRPIGRWFISILMPGSSLLTWCQHMPGGNAITWCRFPYLRMVKVEVEHPVSGLDNLVARLEELAEQLGHSTSPCLVF